VIPSLRAGFAIAPKARNLGRSARSPGQCPPEPGRVSRRLRNQGYTLEEGNSQAMPRQKKLNLQLEEVDPPGGLRSARRAVLAGLQRGNLRQRRSLDSERRSVVQIKGASSHHPIETAWA